MDAVAKDKDIKEFIELVRDSCNMNQEMYEFARNCIDEGKFTDEQKQSFQKICENIYDFANEARGFNKTLCIENCEHEFEFFAEKKGYPNLFRCVKCPIILSEDEIQIK